LRSKAFLAILGLVKPLQPPDTFCLSAAIGWLGLGNWREADEELEQITPDFHVHPDVLEIRWAIYAKAAKWDQCVDIGNALVSVSPERPFGLIRRAFALHCLKRTAEAAEVLAPATVLFPKEWIVPYNLACYACQMGKQDKARQLLENALDLGYPKLVKMLALADPDLQPLWKDIDEV